MLGPRNQQAKTTALCSAGEEKKPLAQPCIVARTLASHGDWRAEKLPSGVIGA
jgi:hypothetical protein